MKFLKLMRKDESKDSVSAGDPSSRQDKPPGIEPENAKTEVAPPKELYVSTSLETWEPTQPDLLARDITLDGVCFRKLDPEFYAWLRHKLTLAEKSLEAGKINYEAFDTLLTRFNDIHVWAVDRFGRDTLAAAMESTSFSTYVPPGNPPLPLSRRGSGTPDPDGKPYRYPKEGEWNFVKNVSSSTIAKVDSIREHALSLGWKESRLYQNRGRFPYPSGDDYGLVCFIRDNTRIGEVASQCIEIIGPPPEEIRTRFYNPDVDQPWINRTKASARTE
jgi:hypothetical protein